MYITRSDNNVIEYLIAIIECLPPESLRYYKVEMTYFPTQRNNIIAINDIPLVLKEIT